MRSKLKLKTEELADKTQGLFEFKNVCSVACAPLGQRKNLLLALGLGVLVALVFLATFRLKKQKRERRPALW